MPVSVHTDANKDEPGTNKVSVMFVGLPVQVEDPVTVLRLIREETKGAKEVHNALGAEVLTGLAEFAPPRLLNQASRLYSRLNLANRHRVIHNLIISNVPGPQIPLYCAGAQVVATYPMGPILEGCGLNITVLSNTVDTVNADNGGTQAGGIVVTNFVGSNAVLTQTAFIDDNSVNNVHAESAAGIVVYSEVSGGGASMTQALTIDPNSVTNIHGQSAAAGIGVYTGVHYFVDLILPFDFDFFQTQVSPRNAQQQSLRPARELATVIYDAAYGLWGGYRLAIA